MEYVREDIRLQLQDLEDLGLGRVGREAIDRGNVTRLLRIEPVPGA